MRAVVQRVNRASVTVDGEAVASIGPGLLVLLGVARGDTQVEAERLASKVAELRILPSTPLRAGAGASSTFDRSLLDAGGEALVVSQFTLLADVRKGRRPSFSDAAPPDEAEPLVEAFAEAMRSLGVRVSTGRFGAHMAVELENDGPVTLVVDTGDLARPRRSK